MAAPEAYPGEVAFARSFALFYFVECGKATAYCTTFRNPDLTLRIAKNAPAMYDVGMRMPSFSLSPNFSLCLTSRMQIGQRSDVSFVAQRRLS